MAKAVSNCKNCGEEFEYYESQSKGKYCSKSCDGGSRDTAVVSCSYCGKEKEIHSSKKNRYGTGRNFCDNQCQNDWRKENLDSKDYWDYDERGDVRCAECGEKFHIPPSEVKENNYCSRECMAEYYSKNYTEEDAMRWSGGAEKYYGSNWFRQRRKALKRDNHKCRDCGVNEEKLEIGLDVHHKIPIKEFEDKTEANRLSNLVSLCRQCHVDREIKNRF